MSLPLGAFQFLGCKGLILCENGAKSELKGGNIVFFYSNVISHTIYNVYTLKDQVLNIHKNYILWFSTAVMEKFSVAIEKSNFLPLAIPKECNKRFRQNNKFSKKRTSYPS